MKMAKRAWAYGIFGLLLFILDRITKYVALCTCLNQCKINEYLSFEVVYNRGISWGIFHSTNYLLFVAVSVAIGIVTFAIAWYVAAEFIKGHFILGPVMVIAGSVSNLIDRVIYGGVVDFIILFYDGCSWPVFNIADICIVIGLFLMVLECYRQ